MVHAIPLLFGELGEHRTILAVNIQYRQLTTQILYISSVNTAPEAPEEDIMMHFCERCKQTLGER